jgi:hypothetical protein
MSMAEFTGQTYGQAEQQRQSQRAVRPGPPPTEGGMGGATGAGFMRPTDNPDESVLAGSTMSLNNQFNELDPIAIEPGSRADLALRVRAIAAKYPNPAVVALMQYLENADA